jgi:hypothetical protein
VCALTTSQWSDLKEGRPLERFATARATYADEKLHRVYSVHSHGCLIVAGGHQVRPDQHWRLPTFMR